MISDYEIHLPTDGKINPNGIWIPSKKIAYTYNDKDAVVFSYLDGGRIILSEQPGTAHVTLCSDFHIPDNVRRVNGRFWTSRKILCFWANGTNPNIYFPSCTEVADIVTKLKNGRYRHDISNYTLIFTPPRSQMFVIMPVEEYIHSNLTGNEGTDFWLSLYMKSCAVKASPETVAKKQQQRQWSDDERCGKEGLQSDFDSPYNDPRYRNFMEEGKIRLSDSDIKKIVTEVVKKILNLV